MRGLPLPDLRERSRESELLDAGVPEAEAARSLADLRFVNRWLGGERSLRPAVAPYLRGGGRLLDVGSGSADLPHRIARANGAPVLAVALDVKLAHLREAPSGIQRVVADVRALPFPPRSFDVVTASAFLHHFDEGEIAEVIRSLYERARRALVVNDLHRSHVPLLFGRAFFPLLFRSPVSVSDGLVSLRRAFRPGELRAAFVRAGIPWVRIRRRFPYRLVAVAERAPGGRAGA